jgi:L-histidine Nalpha-methyltransferase / hercynylcysteine S-oxide synthase
LVNDGVEESPPLLESTPQVDEPDSALFVDLDGANVGFQHWHPLPVTGSNKLFGQSEMGGLWECTSTTLAPHDGFEAMAMYPGYTGMKPEFQIIFTSELTLTE